MVVIDGDGSVLVQNSVIGPYKFEQGVVKFVCDLLLQVRWWVGREEEEDVVGRSERHWCY